MCWIYKCAMCRGVFESGWSKDEALAEKERDFPNIPDECCMTVCEDCYQNVRPDKHPEKWAAFRNLNN